MFQKINLKCTNLGENTMQGIHSGLAKRIDDFLETTTFKSHCGAHKNDLTIKNSFKAAVPNNNHFESVINKFATFYNIQNHKVHRVFIFTSTFTQNFKVLLLEMG